MDIPYQMDMIGNKIYGRVRIYGQTFMFNMTDHLNPPVSKSCAINAIAEWIMEMKDDYDDHWYKDVPWDKDVPWMREVDSVWLNTLTSIPRFTPIGANHSLFGLLNMNARAQRNYLIFVGHIYHAKHIKITHFGPFTHIDRIERLEKRRRNVHIDFRGMLRSLGVDCKEDWDKMSTPKRKDIRKKFDENVELRFMKVRSTKKTALLSAKDVIKELTRRLFGVDSDEAKTFDSGIEKAVTKASLHKVFLLLEKSLPPKNEKKVAEQGSEQVLESASKKVPSGYVAGTILALKGHASRDGAGTYTQLGSGSQERDLKDLQKEIEEASATISDLAEEIEKLESCYAIVKDLMDHPEEKDITSDEGLAFLDAVEHVYKHYSCWD